MNRLVIIGNGFDLAHGLPTRYKDFIDDFWRNLPNITTDNDLVFLCSEKISSEKWYNFQELKTLIFEKHKNDNLKTARTAEFEPINEIYYKDTILNTKVSILKFKNIFFGKISEHLNINNWVDVENEYYLELKKIMKSKSPYIAMDKRTWESEQKKLVLNLNKEFEEVKKLLEKYLNEKVVEKHNLNLDFNEAFNFHNIFSPDIFDNIKRAAWREDFSKEDKDYIDELVREENHGKVKLRFLNFNYTPTLSSYFGMNLNLYMDSVYFIHGKLNSSKNKINFGFGDEMDEDYKLIENINDNEYLKNFKSFQYLQNDTYKKLMDFVESEKFEVFIMGSSCGLSDRTLLNTIFEHENCRLIKVFYYQWEENGEKKDNFTELTQNISRHFNDKKLMRSKIVHKKLEHLMPKIQLPKI